MRSTFFILRYRLRAFGRGIRAHGFEIFFLGPLIVGGALWVVDRNLGHLRQPLADALASGAISAAVPETASLVLALLLVALSLPATFSELYGQRRSAAMLDTLPVAEISRYHASLAVELTRCLPALAVLLLSAGALGGRLLPSPGQLAGRTARCLAALITLALLRCLATLILAHARRRAAGSRSRWRIAGRWLALLGVLALALAAPHPSLRFLLLPLLAPAAQLETTFLETLGSPIGDPALWAHPLALATTAAMLYLLVRRLYLAWRRRDLEVARPLSLPPQSLSEGSRAQPSGATRRAGRGTSRLLAWLRRSPRLGISPALAALIGRDLKLVLRRFSPAVPLSFGLALTIQAVVATVLLATSLPPAWLPRLAVAGLTLSTLATVALVPFLLKHQLPRFWIEKSTGVDLEQIWRAKLWLAGLLAAIPFASGTLILLAAPDLEPMLKGTAMLQLIATTVIVASILGLAVFEIAAQPLLGLVFGSLVGLALAALFVVYPKAWWLWAVFYGYVAGQIAGRATRRVRLVEVEARASS